MYPDLWTPCILCKNIAFSTASRLTRTLACTRPWYQSQLRHRRQLLSI